MVGPNHTGDTMQFMMLLYANEAAYAEMTPDEMKQAMAGYAQYNKDLRAAGVLRHGEPLKPSHTARSLSVKQGKVVSTDGPFAESKEQLGGYHVIEVKDEAEAMMWARKCPNLSIGTVEVRGLGQQV
jgi:hypothetical protein